MLIIGASSPLYRPCMHPGFQKRTEKVASVHIQPQPAADAGQHPWWSQHCLIKYSGACNIQCGDSHLFSFARREAQESSVHSRGQKNAWSRFHGETDRLEKREEALQTLLVFCSHGGWRATGWDFFSSSSLPDGTHAPAYSLLDSPSMSLTHSHQTWVPTLCTHLSDLPADTLLGLTVWVQKHFIKSGSSTESAFQPWNLIRESFASNFMCF